MQTGGAALNAATATPSNASSMVSYSSGTYNLVAQAGVAKSGGTIGLGSGVTKDGCTYLFSTATQDGTYSCKVSKQPAASKDNGWGTAGLMARQSGDAGSPMVGVLATTSNGVQFLWRSTYQGQTSIWPMAIAIGVAAPIWVQLAKSGTNFTVSYSQDGKTWNNPTSMSVSFTGTSYLIGLAAASNSTAQSLDVFSSLVGFKSSPTMYLDISATNTAANSSAASSTSSSS